MANHFSDFDAFDVAPEFKPLGAWAYFGLTILFSIPIIGTIFLIVFSFSDANINRRNFARSYFIMLVISLILLGIMIATGSFNAVLEALRANQKPEFLAFLPFL